MTSDEAVSAVIDVLNTEQIPHMLVGSLATNLYGEPRSTKDPDFVIQLGNRPMSTLAGKLGPDFRFDPQQSFETVTLRYMFKVPAVPFTIEMFPLSSDPHDIERLGRRQPIQLGESPTFVATLEDTIITKLRWCQRASRGKDKDDLRNVLAVQGDQIDWPYVYAWCDRHATRALLDEIRKTIPPI
jgi:hypothetical protein